MPSARYCSPIPCRYLLMTLFLTVITALPVHAEIIILNNGMRIEGQILKDTGDKVIIDLGFEILTVPRDQIQSIDKGEVQQNDGSAAKVTDHLYCVGNFQPAPISDLAPTIEEAVVMVKTPSGLGSGFIINTEGYVITNFHVIEGETRITLNIFRKEGSSYRNHKIEEVRIVATNAFLDVALLKFDPPEGMKLTAVCLSAADSIAEGETVFAIGNPLGLERSVSQGIVSKKNRREDDGLLYIQTTTQINPGNSGGPLFNSRGEVIGVTNAGYLFMEGLNYAIPIRYVIDFLKNREAYTYNLDNPESGYQYLDPGARKNPEAPDFLNPQPTPQPTGDTKQPAKK
ncbi:MAG: hypothetical protein HJJLKODD_01468 [Phycisphaerae bacterium]|nr:hypothetical protein [Phycisphaerae bacterium]